MNLEDKILKAKEFDTEILTKLKEICDILYVFRGEPMYDNNMFNGHISYINIVNNMLVFNLTYINNAGDTISLDIIYEPLCYDGFDNEHVCVPLHYFDMTKEELIEEKQREEEALREKNIVKMYNKKLSDLKQMREQIEQMNDQMNVLKAEIVAVQEEAEELKRLSEKE